jgi:hypothetical protein
MNTYYVYCHIRLDTKEVFYVGKGKKKRAYSKHNRNKYWINIVNSVGYTVEFMYTNLTEDEAFAKEKELILAYKELGQADANFEIGGRGRSGYITSEETKKKISDALKGRTYTPEQIEVYRERSTGKTHTPEVREVIRQANIGRKHLPETIEKCRKGSTGKKQSPEHIAKKAAKTKAYWAKRREDKLMYQQSITEHP